MLSVIRVRKWYKSDRRLASLHGTLGIGFLGDGCWVCIHWTLEAALTRLSTIALSSILSAILVVGVVKSSSVTGWFSPRLAYVQTGKLMSGFSESARQEKKIIAEEERLRNEQKVLQDSLQAIVNRMSTQYNNSSPAQKKSLQDLLSSQNQQLNNFQQAGRRKVEQMRQEMLRGVGQKIDVYIAEYGKKHKYDIIFGTAAGGSILYGGDGRYDVTEEVPRRDDPAYTG